MLILWVLIQIKFSCFNSHYFHGKSEIYFLCSLQAAVTVYEYFFSFSHVWKFFNYTHLQINRFILYERFSVFNVPCNSLLVINSANPRIALHCAPQQGKESRLKEAKFLKEHFLSLENSNFYIAEKNCFREPCEKVTSLKVNSCVYRWRKVFFKPANSYFLWTG